MRIFVTGDVHGDCDYDKLKRFRTLLRDELTLDDYLIICGDFGVLWDGGRQDNYFKEKVYGNFPCTILWVDGNHENFDVLETYPIENWMSGKIHRITDRILHLMRGEIFTLPMADSEISLFAFGGAKSHDRGYDTGRTMNWWPKELPTQEEMDNAIKNLAARNNEVDYIFTHDGPLSILQAAFSIKTSDPCFSSFLNNIADSVRFKGWFFGHHHRDVSMDKFHCMYNSIKELRPKI